MVVVPPNATASVTLPGKSATPIEVSSGTHRWSYPYSIMSNHHPRSLDNTISEFIDDPEAWRTVLTTIRQHIAVLARHMDIGTIMLHNDDLTLEQTLSLLPHTGELSQALVTALAALDRQGDEKESDKNI